MSRSLGDSQCHGPVVVEESPRPITREEAHHLYVEFREHLFANAHCPVCGAKFLAWYTSRESPIGRWYVLTHHDNVIDLSYRHSFRDEPREEDLPTHEVRVIVVTETRAIGTEDWTVYSREVGVAP